MRKIIDAYALFNQNFPKADINADHWSNKEKYPHWKTDITGIQTILENAPAVSEWIPVSERLPEKNGYFLTSTVFNDVYCDFWNGYEFERTEMILAWMPLPEPYKKEGEENDR